MTFRMHTPLIAVAALLALGPSLAMAQTTPRQEDRAQLNADLASLAVERAQLTTDTQARKADRVEGKMAAESRDALQKQSELVNMMADRRMASNAEHRLIAAAIAQGDEAAAQDAMQRHLDRVARAVAGITGGA